MTDLADHQRGSSHVTRYRISPWPLRILVPLCALVGIAGVTHNGTLPALLIPFIVLVAAGYLIAAERIGIYCTEYEIECRTARRGGSFRYAWSEVDHFQLADNGVQIAVVVYLRDGSQRLIPPTRAWWYQRSTVAEMCSQLNRRAKAGA